MDQRPATAPSGGAGPPPQPYPAGMDGMQPPRGVANSRSLFAEALRDPDDRIDRLETAVQGLRDDFDAVSPAIARLVAVEGDLQDLITQIEALLDPTAYIEEAAPLPAPPVAAAPVARPMPLRPAPVPQESEPDQELEEDTSPPAPADSDASESAAPVPAGTAATQPAPAPLPAGDSGGKPQVTNLRAGEHPGKTRIVLDVNAPTSYRHDLDNGEMILVLELPETAWNARPDGTFGSSPLLKSYKAEPLPGGKGSLVVLQLKGPARIAYTGVMKGAGGTGQRIIIDLAPGASTP